MQAVLFEDNCITVVRWGRLWGYYVVMMRSMTVRVSHSHADILTSVPARFNYTAGIQRWRVSPRSFAYGGSLARHNLKTHNKLTRRWRPRLSVCSLHWCDLLSHQQLKDADFIIASRHANWERLIYDQPCEELQQMVKLSTIMTTVAKEHSVTGFLSPLCFPTRSARRLW